MHSVYRLQPKILQSSSENGLQWMILKKNKCLKAVNVNRNARWYHINLSHVSLDICTFE